MASPSLGQIEAFLHDALKQMEPEADWHGRGRPRILPSVCLWAGLLVCLLHRQVGQTAIWRLLSQRGLWTYPQFPLSDQAVYKRLAQAGTAPLEDLFIQISTRLQQRLLPFAPTTLAPFATAVVAFDETSLDPVARYLPALRDAPADRLPGTLTAVFDLRFQQFSSIAYQADPHQNEKVAARDRLDGLAPGTLVVADLGYFGFAWFDDLTDRGYWWLSRLRAQTSYTPLHTFYRHDDTFDGLVWLGAYRADRAKHAKHAKHAVRLVQYRVGATLHQYVTNVLDLRDPQIFPLAQIAQVYARRWDIELAFKLIKREVGLHLWWSSKLTIILQQVWGVLIIAQILQALRLEIAGRAGVDPFVDPFAVSMPLLVQYAPAYAADGLDPIAVWLAHGREARFIRPSRRLVVQMPDMPLAALAPPPPDLVLVRPPRYAHRA